MQVYVSKISDLHNQKDGIAKGKAEGRTAWGRLGMQFGLSLTCLSSSGFNRLLQVPFFVQITIQLCPLTRRTLSLWVLVAGFPEEKALSQHLSSAPSKSYDLGQISCDKPWLNAYHTCFLFFLEPCKYQTSLKLGMAMSEFLPMKCKQK